MKSEVVERMYRDVPAARCEVLERFRATHPYKRLRVDGVEWTYIACGEGEQALLGLGGAMSTAESSFQTITQAEQTYRVVSPSYPPISRMGQVTDGLVAILDAEGISRTHVMGHSLGAAVAHVLVRRHPERVDKVILSGLGLYNERNIRRARSMVRLFALLPYWFVSGYYKRRMAKLLSSIDEGERAFMLAYANDLLDLQLDKRALMAQFGLLEDMVENAEVYGIYDPVERGSKVLILQAKDDTGFQPDEQAVLRATYPGAQVYLFEAGGHMAGITRREEYDAVRYAFLRGEPGEG